MSEKLPPAVKRAAAKFRKQRADYYRYVADLLRSSNGQTKFEVILARDAQRYLNTPRGILSTYWYEQYQQNGANLAAAYTGTLPADEVSIIRVAQQTGAQAVIDGLDDVARLAALNDKIRSESITILFAAVFGFVIAAVMLTVFAVFSSEKLQEVYRFIPLSEWGPKGKAFVNYANGVKDYGIYVLAIFSFLVYIVAWSFSNFTGPARDWLDRKIGIYKTVRDIKGALFLATMATLTRKRATGGDTLIVSLQTLLQSITTPWLRWRVEEIINNIETSGAVSSDAFQTSLISREMFYFLRDTQESLGFSEGFAKTGAYVENTVIKGIVSKLNVFRVVLFLVAILSVIVIMGWQSAVMFEMKGVMLNYFSSR